NTEKSKNREKLMEGYKQYTLAFNTTAYVGSTGSNNAIDSWKISDAIDVSGNEFLYVCGKVTYGAVAMNVAFYTGLPSSATYISGWKNDDDSKSSEVRLDLEKIPV